MNEYLVGAVIVSSAAGWLGGFYFERQKGRREYMILAQNAMRSTNQLFTAAMNLMVKADPNADPDKIAQSLIDEGNKLGMHLMVRRSTEEIISGNN